MLVLNLNQNKEYGNMESVLQLEPGDLSSNFLILNMPIIISNDN